MKNLDKLREYGRGTPNRTKNLFKYSNKYRRNRMIDKTFKISYTILIISAIIYLTIKGF